MNDIKVSIIVGLYNVATFLKKTKLTCIFNQTYTNWELLLIDDGSTDETLELCYSLALQDQRVKVIHKENGGLGSARNVGIDMADGDFLWFYDVDDEVELNLLSYCVQEMNNRNVDLVIFGFWAVTFSRNLVHEIRFAEREIHNSSDLRVCYVDELLLVPVGNGFAWNKFYRRSFLQSNCLYFGNQRIQQDEVFNLKVYQHIRHMYISPVLLYHYHIYDTGNTRSRFIIDRFDIYKSVYNAFRELQTQWNIQDTRFDEYLYKRFYNGIGQCLGFNLFHPACSWNLAERKKELHRVMNDTVSKQSIQYMKQNDLLRWKERICLQVYQWENLSLIRVCVVLFTFLSKLKIWMYRLMK